MTEDRLRKLLEQVEGLEKDPGSTAFVNLGDADDAENMGLIERGTATEMRLTPQGKARLEQLRSG